MHAIEMQGMSPEFFDCWRAAGEHLNRQVAGGMVSWLRAHPNPPFLEHLSFRLGNQLFFVRIEDVDGAVEGPGSVRGLAAIAGGCSGHACVLPMRRRGSDGGWAAAAPGWGLRDAATGAVVDPPALVTDERIAMTRWELHDLGVQLVRGELGKQGRRLLSWQGNPDVDPSVWFVGASGKPEWVVVRVATHPSPLPTRPANWDDIARGCRAMGERGHFAAVGLASVGQRALPATAPAEPLWRGGPVRARFDGFA